MYFALFLKDELLSQKLNIFIALYINNILPSHTTCKH